MLFAGAVVEVVDVASGGVVVVVGTDGGGGSEGWAVERNAR